MCASPLKIRMATFPTGENQQLGPLEEVLNASPKPLAPGKADSFSLGSSHIRFSRNSKREPHNKNTPGLFPEIQLAPWGGRWSKDILVLLHNAVLAETRDVFRICSILERNQFVLNREHVHQFYDWFDDFHQFVRTSIAIEEEYIFPWITRNEEQEVKAGPMRAGARMLYFGTVRRSLQLIADYRSQFHPHLPVGERVSGLLEIVQKLSVIPAFYAEAHNLLPDIVESRHIWTPWKRSSVLRGIVLGMRKCDKYETNLVLLTRWMSESDAKTWIKSMLRNPADIMQFGKWRQAVVQNHCSFPKNIETVIDAQNAVAPEPSSAQVLPIGVAMEICGRDTLEASRISMLPKSSNGKIPGCTIPDSVPTWFHLEQGPSEAVHHQI